MTDIPSDSNGLRRAVERKLRSKIWLQIYRVIESQTYDVTMDVLDQTLSIIQAFCEQREREIRLDTIDKVYELSPTKKFEDWKPHEAFTFYERLKAYEAEIQSHQPGGEEK